MKIVVVIQARTGSTRLPGKVLLPLAGRPLLWRMIERVLAASTPSEVIVATTADPSDDAIARLSEELGVPYVRGHTSDLLDRHYAAGMDRRADAVVKIPSDCPLIDPSVIDRVVGYYRSHADCVDYVSNLHPPSYPDGQDVEVMSMAALAAAWRNAAEDFEREHTTPFIWLRRDQFRVENVLWESGADWSESHRWTIDYLEDYWFVRAVYELLWTVHRPVFSMADVFDLLDRRPDVAAINCGHLGKSWMKSQAARLIRTEGRPA